MSIFSDRRSTRISANRTASAAQGLRVRAYRSLDELAPLGEALDALNRVSRRPTPFDTFAYLQTFLEHDEFKKPGQEMLFLVAFEGDTPVGFLPLRRETERTFGVPHTAIHCLMTHDNERPRTVARPEDEARASEAFYRYLLEEERGWDLLQLQEQDADSKLHDPPASLDLRRYYLRHFPNNPNATISTRHDSFAQYVGGFPKDHRKQLRGAVRRLCEAGEVEFCTGRDPRALPLLFELYLDIERRSWKAGIGGHIARHPERVAFFRRLLEPDRPMKMEIFLTLLDGVPIAGLITGVFDDQVIGFEEAFDEAYRALSPGNVMMLAVVKDTIERKRRCLDLLGNYAYYKAQWGATITDTEAVQLFRKGSLVHLKALAGNAWRALRPPVSQREVSHNLDRPAKTQAKAQSAEASADPANAAASVTPPRSAERERASVALRSIEASGTPLERAPGSALLEALLQQQQRPRTKPRPRVEAP